MTGGIAAALTAALAEAGAAPDPAYAAPLAARAGASGVTTPAQATAFARLSAAGLPTRPAAVTGFADLLVGMPVGRALAALIDAARSGVPATTPGGAEVRALGDQLARLAQRVAHGSVSGDGDALCRAVAELGADAVTRTTGGEAPGPSVRALLGALASAPADPALARAAVGLADALGAQPLAGPAGGGGAAPPPPPHEGVYLQLPLPGGGTAQVRVDPDGPEGRGGARGRRVALLLDLSALGRVMITATTGEGAVDARVRAEREDARAFLAARSGELARALGESERPARVRVEAVAGPVPERLLAPPPALAVDRRA
jgi:hypothetical protein